eukprot:9283458-Heterocapsa_arctica.AAC.1
MSREAKDKCGWTCPALNGVINFGLQQLKQRRTNEEHKPPCFWIAGIVPSDWTTLPDSEFMKATEVRHPYGGR